MALTKDEEIRLHALRLALEHFRGRNVSDMDIELQADKFKNYLRRGTMNRGI